MPQIDVPFLPGEKVRVKATGYVAAVVFLEINAVGSLVFISGTPEGYFPHDLEAVEPVIEWQRDPVYDCWRGSPWAAFDSGKLGWKEFFVGTFSDARAVAEETQALWNEWAVSNEGEGK